MKHYLLILSLLLYSVICIGDDSTSFENTISIHINSSEKLRFIMLNLQSTLNSSEHSDIQQSQIFNDNIADLLTAVENLLNNTALMKTEVPNLNLSEQELNTFQSIANQLYIDVLNLQKATNHNDYSRIEMAYRYLNQSCINCHQLFRF
jgi:hypothetical protein